jgi:hypothetical protein
MLLPAKLPPEKLYRTCNPEEFGFTTTAEFDGAVKTTGQQRALDAITFSMGIRHDGFNLFALGPNGTGKQTAITSFLNGIAPGSSVPSDWCYVNNFEKPRHPKALKLPAGKAALFSRDVEHLVEALFTVIPAAFSSEEYQAQEKNIREKFQEQQAEAIGELEEKATEKNIALIRTPAGFAFAPVKKGEVIKSEEFMKLSKEEQDSIEQEIENLKTALQSIMSQIRRVHEAQQGRTGLHRTGDREPENGPAVHHEPDTEMAA